MNIHAIQTPKPEKKEKVRVSWNPNLTDEEALVLNKKLMKACLACDFAGVEALLEQGADPLGSCTADGHDNDELVLESLFRGNPLRRFRGCGPDGKSAPGTCPDLSCARHGYPGEAGRHG